MENRTFRELGLSEIILAALDKKGFEQPTQIQEETIPLMLSDDRDIIGQAQTGTGKTAAFGLPIIEKLEPTTHHIQALVLTATCIKGRKTITNYPYLWGAVYRKTTETTERRQ